MEQFEDVPIEADPSPKARKSPWIIIALGFTLPLIFEIYHLVSSKTPEVPNSVTTPTPTLVAKVEPPAAAVVTHSAAVVSSPTPASDTSPSVVLVTPSEPVAPVASPTVVSVPSETIAVLKSETKPDTSIAEKPGTFQLPHTFESALEPVMLPIVAVRAGIFSISPVTSTTAYSVISPGLTDKKVWFEQKIKELKTKVTVEHARWEGEKQINREQTPKVKLPETSLKEWNLKKELEKALADLREIELKIQACSVQRSYFGGYETQFTTQDGATVAMGEKIGEAVSKKLKKIATRVPNDIAVLIANGSVTLAANGVHLQVLSGNVDFGAGRDSEVTFVVRMSEESISSVEKVHFELLNISIGEEAKLSEASSGPFSGTLVSNPVETIRAASSGLLVLKSLLNRQGIGVTRGTEVGWYETVNLGEEYLSLKEAAEKIGRLKQQLVLINDLKLELKRAQAEINKLSELQSPDRNQEEADKKQLTPELKSLFDDIKSFESVKADEAKRPEDAEKEEKPRDGISRILRHYAELRNSESKLQAKGIIWSECHKILELLNAELVKFESGDAPNFNTVAEKINELFQKDLSFIPSAEEKEAVRKRLQDEKKRMESRLLIVVSPGKDMTLDQAFDDHSQKIKSLLALLEAGVNASKIVAAVDGRIIKPADSFLIYAEKGQELFAISTGSTVTLSIPQDKASSFKQDDDVLVAIGPSVTKGRVSGLSPLPDNKFEVKIVLPFASGNAEIPVRIYTVHAKSLGAFDRREFLKLAALVGAALAAGCQITKERIEQIRNDHGIGVPNSLTTPASEVNLKEIILKLNDIAERHKNQTDESGFKSLIEYLPARNHGIREAQYKKDDAQGTSSFMAGFGITPQFSVNHDLNGGVGINGGFVIQIPTALGGGALYFPFGVNSLEEDVKATFSFVASTQNLVMGLGNYYSDLSDIAVRSAVYELQNLIVTEVARVQHLYRELYFLKKSEEILKSQLVILNDEKTYAQNLNDRAYQKKVLEKVAAKQGELDSVREGIEDKIELLYRALNISPEVPFNFNDFEELKTQAVETFEVSGDTEKEILRRVALVDKRVGLAHDRFTAFSYLKLLDERKANIPDAVLYLFGGHGVNQTTDLSFGNDQNRINFIRRSLREGGMILRLPELTTFIPRIFSGNIDDIDALKRQRVEMIDEVKKLVLEEVRDSKKDYDRRLAAIIKAQRALSTAQRELVSLDSDRENEEATFADVFAKRIEIQDLEMDLGKKKMEFQEALSKFSGYFPDAAEWKRNKLNKAREGEVIREESKPHLDDMRDFVNSSISYQTRQFDSVEALVDSVNGKSLGRELSSNLKDRGLLSNHILAGRIGFLSVLFGSILGVRSRKMAWAKFQERFGKKLDAFTQDPRTQSKVEKLTKPVSIFIEESDLSVRPEFLVQFLQRSVHVDVFVQAGNRANALVKLAAYFPEASIPKNLSVHYYNPSLPLHDAMSRQIKLANESNIVPVVIGDGAKFFKKLEVRTRIIKVSHQKVYPKELVLELGRRIGISNGMIGQIAGDERGLIGYDDKRDMFNLLPLEKLIDELFQQVVRDYQLQIAA
ncbi:MAG: hypothetical protein HZC17_03775 [Candidatus Omnitrophica bacterium]|nr:hypothetical protein [Candidatus Omnitrophota bacterium]